MYSQTKRRDKLEIIIDIIECIDEYSEGGRGARKTAVEQCAGLNTTNFRRYLDMMLKAGIIHVASEGNRQLLFITPHGRLVYMLAKRLSTLITPPMDNKQLAATAILQKLLDNIEAYKARAAPDARLAFIALAECDYILGYSESCVVCLKQKGNTLLVKRVTVSDVSVIEEVPSINREIITRLSSLINRLCRHSR